MTKENLYTPNCIRTFTGKYINPANPNPELICIEDIAHALSMQPRFGGHLPVFYSVAQHCCRVSFLVPDHLRLPALMHDASEAYLIDVPKPIKSQLSEYKEYEMQLMYEIAKKFGFIWPGHEKIDEADIAELELEWDELMLGKGYPKTIIPLSQAQAKQQFIDLFKLYQ